MVVVVGAGVHGGAGVRGGLEVRRGLGVQRGLGVREGQGRGVAVREGPVGNAVGVVVGGAVGCVAARAEVAAYL